MNKKWQALLFLALDGWSYSVCAGGNVDAGKAKSATCVACHGAEGKTSIPMYPNLAGQNAFYLKQALHAYQKGLRSGGQADVMKPYLEKLSNQDISDLAAYYASLTP